jgi:2-keto-4-pentenoate hydratase/2-oxohepta-3-ene-1,7-dioic acid hydratase in catechol pathway
MFRLLNVDGRAALEREGSWFDLGRLSGDEALADPMAAVARSGELHALTERCDPADAEGPLAGTTLGAPVPEPRQVFGIGLNYRDHSGESGTALPPAPLTFTKFPSCIVGPTSSVARWGQ